MMVFKRAVPRRTFLRGLGAALALPLLDGMVPAFAGTGEGANRPSLRMGFIYLPNGIIMEQWTPQKQGATFDLTPTLQPLAPFRDSLVVLSGLTTNGSARLLNIDPGAHS